MNGVISHDAERIDCRRRRGTTGQAGSGNARADTPRRGALFYDEGIRAVSADRVVRAVGINKGTFYRYFPTKDDLTVAYLERRSALEQEAARQILDAQPGDPAAVLRGDGRRRGGRDLLARLPRLSVHQRRGRIRGPDPSGSSGGRPAPAMVQGMLEQQLQQLDVVDAPLVADELILLRDGSMVSGYLSDPTAVGPNLGRAVQAILDDAS